MKTIEEKAQIFLDTLHLYNRELKHENDEINKNAIIRLLKEQDKITRHACAKNVRDYNSDDELQSIIINTKAI